MIVRLLGVASLADAAWQLLDRKGWARVRQGTVRAPSSAFVAHT